METTMVMLSSISSFNLNIRRFPLAFLGAVLLLAGVEVGVRLLPYNQRAFYERGTFELPSVRQRVDSFGSGQVVVLGSSRARDAVLAPRMRSALRQKLGIEVRVENYGTAASTSIEAEALVQRMSRNREFPRTVIYPVSPRTLRNRLRHDNEAQYWSVADWIAAPVKHFFAADQLPAVVRGGVAEVSASFAYRQRAALFFSDPEAALRPLSFPAIGGSSHTHIGRPMDTLIARREIITPDRVKNYVRSLMRTPDRFPLDSENVQALEDLTRRAREFGADVVFVELPLPDILLREYPAGTYDLFLKTIKETAAKTGARFLRLADLGAFLTDEMFRDQSHVNYLGAALFTDALTSEVVAPFLMNTGQWTRHNEVASNGAQAEVATQVEDGGNGSTDGPLGLPWQTMDFEEFNDREPVACKELGSARGVLAVRGCLTARRFGEGVTRGWLQPGQEATVVATGSDGRMPGWGDQSVTMRVYIQPNSEPLAEGTFQPAFRLITRFTGLDDYYAAEWKPGGELSLTRVMNGERKVLAHRIADIVPMQEYTHFTFLALGDELLFLIGDRKVLCARDPEIFEGTAGFESKNLEVYLDNWEMRLALPSSGRELQSLIAAKFVADAVSLD